MRFVNTKTVILLVVILVLLLLIKNIVGSILTLRQNSHIVTTLKLQEKSEEQRGKFLEQQLYEVNSQQFIENQAREKLGMVQPGEHIVIAPAPTTHTNIVVENTPNWTAWWKLFF